MKYMADRKAQGIINPLGRSGASFPGTFETERFQIAILCILQVEILSKIPSNNFGKD